MKYWNWKIPNYQIINSTIHAANIVGTLLYIRQCVKCQGCKDKEFTAQKGDKQIYMGIKIVLHSTEENPSAWGY